MTPLEREFLRGVRDKVARLSGEIEDLKHEKHQLQTEVQRQRARAEMWRSRALQGRRRWRDAA